MIIKFRHRNQSRLYLNTPLVFLHLKRVILYIQNKFMMKQKNLIFLFQLYNIYIYIYIYVCVCVCVCVCVYQGVLKVFRFY